MVAREEAAARAGRLTPVTKVFCSEIGVEIARSDAELRRKRFGTSSERTDRLLNQLESWSPT